MAEVPSSLDQLAQFIKASQALKEISREVDILKPTDDYETAQDIRTPKATRFPPEITGVPGFLIHE
jgi:hypothetical protein